LVADVAQLPQGFNLLRISFGHAVECLTAQIELASLLPARPINSFGRKHFLKAGNVEVPCSELVADIDVVSVYQRHHGVSDFSPSLLVSKLRIYFHVDRHADMLRARQSGDTFTAMQSNWEGNVRKHCKK